MPTISGKAERITVPAEFAEPTDIPLAQLINP
jgi:hypothetical protein